MAEILSAAVDQLGQGIEQDATRTAAAQMLGSLAELERALMATRLH